MADSEIEEIKQLDSDATEDLTDQQLQTYINNAHLIALTDKFPRDVEFDSVPVLTLATRYMALHLISTRSGTAGSGVISEKVDVLETHYANTGRLDWYSRSPWGQLYLKLLKEFARLDTSFVVIQH